MASCNFIYRGTVRGQGRPRFTSKGRAFKDKATRDYENAIRSAFIDQCSGFYSERPIEVTIIVYRALPKSRPKRIESEPDTFKPDLDNIVKAVMDALNGIAWRDDAQIVSINASKEQRTRRHVECLIIGIEER